MLENNASFFFFSNIVENGDQSTVMFKTWERFTEVVIWFEMLPLRSHMLTAKDSGSMKNWKGNTIKNEQSEFETVK